MITSRRFGSRNGCSHARACSMLATMLRCSSIAPFATPVVPPVYCRNAMSSCAERHALERALAARRRARRTAGSSPGSDHAGTIFFTCRSTKSTMMPLKPSSSPIDVTIDLPDLGLADAPPRTRVREVLDDDDHLGARIVELVLELARACTAD